MAIEKKLAAIKSDSALSTPETPDVYSSEEFRDLEKLAKSPALRAEAAHAELILNMTERNRILQQKLDKLEQAYPVLLGEVCELRQAKRSVRLIDWYTATAIAVGGGLISAGGYFDDPNKKVVVAIGWTLNFTGLLLMFSNNFFGWPPSKKT